VVGERKWPAKMNRRARNEEAKRLVSGDRGRSDAWDSMDNGDEENSRIDWDRYEDLVAEKR
jgi:hypothetical protein